MTAENSQGEAADASMTHAERALVGTQHPLVGPLGDMVEPPVALLMSRPEPPGCRASGVSVSETNTDTRIATAIVTANSRNRRPMSPPKQQHAG